MLRASLINPKILTYCYKKFKLFQLVNDKQLMNYVFLFAKKIIGIISIFLLLSNSTLAVDILTSAEKNFFSADDTSRVGVEVEFSGLSLDKSTKKIQSVVGGTAKFKTMKTLTTIKGYDESGKVLYNEVDIPYYEIKNSKLGNLVIKVETNQLSTTEMAKDNKAIIELVTDPISGINKMELLQKAVSALENAGAVGTSADLAVSTQINVEIQKGVKSKIHVMDTINLLRTYFRKEHWDQIHMREKIPASRKPYVQAYSPEFMSRLMDPEYKPRNWQQFFDDFIYRQSLELLGEKKAWTMPIKDARAKLLSYKEPIVPRVVKQNALRISSLLAYMVPNDPMTKIMTHPDTGWIKPYPIIEFREWNNTFDVIKPYKYSLGLVSAADQFGYYDHDRLLSELSGVPLDQIKELRKRALSSEKTGKAFSWRYFLADPELTNLKPYIEHKNMNYRQKDLVGFLSPNYRGTPPALYIPGESVIMHRRPIHATNITGKYNPGLTNHLIALALENKYVEAKFFEDLIPGVMPNTKLLNEVIGKTTDINKITKKLNASFPSGWIMKGIWDLGTEGMLISNEMDLAKEIEIYKRSDFEVRRKRLLSDPEWKNIGEEYFLAELRKFKGYKGWKILQLLKNRTQFLVQEKMDIRTEYRVEVLGGKVLGNGSTIDRYAYKTDYKIKPDPKEVRRVEKYVTKIIKKLPTELQGTPFAFDIAVSSKGKLMVVESNPGSNSNFLYEEDWKKSINALSNFLDSYPSALKQGLVPVGMDEKTQLKWLQEKFAKWNINTQVQYAGYFFDYKNGAISDHEYPFKKISPNKYQVAFTNCEAGYKALGNFRDR